VKLFQLIENRGNGNFRKVHIQVSEGYTINRVFFFSQEINQFTDSNGYLTFNNLKECFKILFERYGVSYRPEELMLLCQRFCVLSQAANRDIGNTYKTIGRDTYHLIVCSFR
jgi:hypothetical protein